MKRKFAKFGTKWFLSITSKRHLFALLPLCYFLSSCRTASIQPSDIRQGKWAAKVLVKDMVQGKSYLLIMKVNAIIDERLRADLSSTLTGSVASFVLTGDQLNYIVVPQKKYYEGPSRSQNLLGISPIPFDPKWLYNILVNRPFVERDWACQTNRKGALESCRNLKMNIQVTWDGEGASSKSVKIEHDRGSLQMKFQSFQTQLDDLPGLFSLKAPASYKKIQ